MKSGIILRGGGDQGQVRRNFRTDKQKQTLKGGPPNPTGSATNNMAIVNLLESLIVQSMYL